MGKYLRLDEVRPQYSWGGDAIDAYGEFSRKFDNSVGGLVAKTAVQLIDPTGISSWGDVHNAWKDYKNGKGSLLNAIVETAGALPALGVVSRIPKTFTKTVKAGNILRNMSKIADAQKRIDTLGELAGKIPYIGKPIAKLNQGTQAVTAAIPNYLFGMYYHPYRKGSKVRSMNAAKKVDGRDIWNDIVVPMFNYGFKSPDQVNDFYSAYTLNNKQ